MSNPDRGGAPAQPRRAAAALGQLSRGSDSTVRADKSRVTTAKVVQARQTPGSSNDDNTATSAKPLNPCKLVSLAEAQTITRGAITKLIEAPLGPTCIYSGRDSSAGVTLAIETESLSQVTSRMTSRKHVVVSGRRSVCGRLGTQMLFVPVGRYQLMNVTAPCGIARGFAAIAVSRLSA
jgi:hypothetical protein